MTLYKYTGNYYFGGIIMRKLLVKALSYGDDWVSGLLQRYKSRANAKQYKRITPQVELRSIPCCR